MRLALSTLGCPELTLAEAADLAHRHGYAGLELRSAPGATVEAGASLHQRAQWKNELHRAEVEALSIASYVTVCDTQVEDETVLETAVDHARLAADLGAHWLRVFPGGPRGGPPDPTVDAIGGRRLAAIVAATAHLGVGLALETHDSHPRGQDVLRIIDATDGAEVGVIWDVLHTWLADESPQETSSALGSRLAYTQVKDVASAEDLAPLALGAGVLPLRASLAAVPDLMSSWVSWEYEKVWHPEAPALADLAGPARRWLDESTSTSGGADR